MTAAIIVPDGPAMTPAERRKVTRRDPEPRGYAARPGTGPAGETCRTCRHNVVTEHAAKPYHKCELMRRVWTGGRATDILVRSPACSQWERAYDRLHRALAR